MAADIIETSQSVRMIFFRVSSVCEVQHIPVFLIFEKDDLFFYSYTPAENISFDQGYNSS